MFEWQKWVLGGRKYMHSYPKSDPPKAIKNDKDTENIWNLVHSDQCLIIVTMAQVLNMNKESIRKIMIQDLRVQRWCPKFWHMI